MFEIIDLSQEIFTNMPVFPGLPEVKTTVHQSHEQLEGIIDSEVVSPAVNRLELGEYTGTHVDALNHGPAGAEVEFDGRITEEVVSKAFGPMIDSD